MEVDEELDEKFVERYEKFLERAKGLPLTRHDRDRLQALCRYYPHKVAEFIGKSFEKSRGKFLDLIEGMAYTGSLSSEFLARQANTHSENARKFTHAIDTWNTAREVCLPNDNETFNGLVVRHADLVNF